MFLANDSAIFLLLPTTVTFLFTSMLFVLASILNNNLAITVVLPVPAIPLHSNMAEYPLDLSMSFKPNHLNIRLRISLC